MSQILQWLTSNPLVGMITLITFLLIVISVVVIYLVAFFQGQEISFWPPQISQKPETIVKNRQIVKNKEITTIQFCDDFWKKNQQYNTMYVWALNGAAFLKMIMRNNITITQNMKIILPSEDVIKTYYDHNSNNHSNGYNPVDGLLNSIENTQHNLEKAVRIGHISEYEIKRIRSFPLFLYAIFDDKMCLMGEYAYDELKEKTIGLKSCAWVEYDSEIIRSLREHFEGFWKLL